MAQCCDMSACPVRGQKRRANIFENLKAFPDIPVKLKPLGSFYSCLDPGDQTARGKHFVHKYCVLARDWKYGAKKSLMLWKVSSRVMGEERKMTQ